MSPDILRWVLSVSFIGMGIWTLRPDKIDERETQFARHFGVFGATLISFFLAEMGDKTQLATVALAAHYSSTILVVVGTTLGILLADIPPVFVGDKIAARFPMQLVRSVAAAVFALLGFATLLGTGSKFGF